MMWLLVVAIPTLRDKTAKDGAPDEGRFYYPTHAKARWMGHPKICGGVGERQTQILRFAKDDNFIFPVLGWQANFSSTWASLPITATLK